MRSAELMLIKLDPVVTFLGSPQQVHHVLGTRWEHTYTLHRCTNRSQRPSYAGSDSSDAPGHDRLLPRSHRTTGPPNVCSATPRWVFRKHAGRERPCFGRQARYILSRQRGEESPYAHGGDCAVSARDW